ncbi:nitroreductase [Thermobaculum terrenum ATCC BAA-798]|uniref:Putative NAD(P)H nitroreductase n=1 Tax=Thermobaculum terrenum (strain ATCC BAA-798 / CCMEE 7001 / YNP1) TaxID=525904 RepID=D1CH50_THET1|nr:nitroreductase [Thermobaculum terrenum]ACZ43071.1 nitroreductase [Thermobaculum terrenum ATCC BAA-798]
MAVELERRAPKPEAQRLLELIRSRRSVGKVAQDPPPRELIEQVLEAAVTAPNHHLTQPWRFFVIAGSARERLGEAMAAAESRAHPDSPQAALDRVRAKPLRAPVIIAVAVQPSDDPRALEIEEVEAGAAAVQNMLLAAHALGLAAMWRTGDAAYADEVKAFLGLDTSAHIIGFIYLGYAAITPPDPPRRSAAELTQWLGWGEKA